MATILKWIIGAVVGVFVVVIGFLQIDPNVNQISSNEQISSFDENMVSIEIIGQVVHPGTYTIDETLTIKDLVELAGGYLASADLDAINEDIILTEITSVYVAPISGYNEACVIDPNAKKVNINTASVSELQEVNGLSQLLAERIVAYREENGLFNTLEEIQNVLGIGTKTFEKIRDYITLK